MNPVLCLPGCRPLALLGVLAATLLLPAADQPAPAADKTHVLFMGTDLEVQVGKAMHRVRNVAGDSFIVSIDQRPAEVPMNRGAVAMKVTPQLKLSSKIATVNALQFERAYTPQNDPVKKWAASQSGGAGQAAVGNTAGQMGSALMGAQLAGQRAAALGGGMTTVSTGDASAQIRAFDNASRAAGSDLNSAGYASGLLQAELDKQLFDAMLVTCEVSAPRALRDPYLVVITHYREKDQPAATKSWIFAKALERLDEHPLKVRILQGGFPPGFEVVKHQLHLYGAGSEVGTNVSDKNVFLTRDEAHEYIVIDHLTTHKGATVAPSVALGVSSKDFYPHYGAEQVKQLVYIKVSKDGRPQGAFLDEACAKPAGDAYLEKLLAQTLFKPALKAGKAVDGVARLQIAELAL